MHTWKALVLGLSAALAWHGACAENLREVVEAALKTNPRVAAAAAEGRAAQQDVAQARAGYYPTVDVNLGGGRERTSSPQTRALNPSDSELSRRESGLTVSQRLFDGGAVRSDVQRLTARADVAAARLRQVREEVALQAVQAYVEVLANRRLVRLANDNLRAHLLTMERVRQRVEGGVSQRSDLHQVQGRIALAKSIVTARAGRMREVETAFERVVGRAPRALEELSVRSSGLVGSGGEVDTARLSQSTQNEVAAALQANPVLGAAAAEIRAAEAAVQGSRSGYWPRVNLELTTNRNNNIAGLSGLYSSDALLLVLRWNLFRGGADNAAERASIERRYAAVDAAADARREVHERVAR